MYLSAQSSATTAHRVLAIAALYQPIRRTLGSGAFPQAKLIYPDTERMCQCQPYP